MLRTQLGRQPHKGSKGATEVRMQHMVVFSVGGQRLAARTEEIGGVMPWTGSTAVPSDTPFVRALVRQEKGCLPVFDLAAKFKRSLQDGEPLSGCQTCGWTAGNLYRFPGSFLAHGGTLGSAVSRRQRSRHRGNVHRRRRRTSYHQPDNLGGLIEPSCVMSLALCRGTTCQRS